MRVDVTILDQPQVQASFNGVAIPKVIRPMVEALNGVVKPEPQPAIPNVSEAVVSVSLVDLVKLQALATSTSDQAKTINKILAALRLNGDIVT